MLQLLGLLGFWSTRVLDNYICYIYYACLVARGTTILETRAARETSKKGAKGPRASRAY